MKVISLFIIKQYQTFISPLIGNNCRFYPTCSQYAQEAISTYGFIKGGFLFIKRIIKCQPFHHGGLDFLPKIERRPK